MNYLAGLSDEYPGCVVDSVVAAHPYTGHFSFGWHGSVSPSASGHQTPWVWLEVGGQCGRWSVCSGRLSGCV